MCWRSRRCSESAYEHVGVNRQGMEHDMAVMITGMYNHGIRAVGDDVALVHPCNDQRSDMMSSRANKSKRQWHIMNRIVGESLTG